MGFGGILELDDCCVPRSFVQWVADNVCTDDEHIYIGSTAIQLSPQSVEDTLGTPSGEIPVDSDEEIGKAAFLALFGLIEVPSIRFFGKKILGKEALPDDVFCRCFMAVCLSTFFCPNSNTKPSTKYMGALIVVDKIKLRNWSKFIHEWMIFYIKKYRKEPSNSKQLTLTLGGCIYHLAVRCLDFIDFGPVQMPQTLPRIRVWKGNLIKVFSNMYMGTDGKYGAYPVRDISETCYSKDTNTLGEGDRSDAVLKQQIDESIGGLLGNKLKEAISTSFITIMKDESTNVVLKAQELVVQVVQLCLSNKDFSQDTLKISSSDQGSYKNENDSQNTIKLPSEDEDDYGDDNDDQPLIQRKRRRIEVKTSSQQSNHSETAMRNDQRNNCSNGKANNSPIEEVSVENEVVRSLPVQSASLEYMLPDNLCASKKMICEDVSSKETNPSNILDKPTTDKPPVVYKRRKISEERIPSFSGFNGIHANQEVSKASAVFVETAATQEGCSAFNKDIDVNLPNIGIIVEHYARTQLNIRNPANRGEYLEMARQKYYFKDTPSFRLVEEEDDNGKKIEEPELYRPLDMDNYTYNQMIESAILKYKNASIIASESKECKTPSLSNPITCNQNEISECYTSVQCAQREPSITGLTKSARREPELKHDFVNLISPEAINISQDHKDINEISPADRKTPDYSKALIVGRRLFDGSDDDFMESNSKSPLREMLNTVGNDSSPEVQFIGENLFKSTHNNMSRETDELYNTSLSLGNSSSHHGKENMRPWRIPQRSKFVCSPFDVNPSVQIQPVHQKIWESVTTLCDIDPPLILWAVNIDTVKVSMLQLGTSMKIDGWVEAWLMNAFCRKLFRDNHPRKTNKHFFFNTISDYFLQKWKCEEARLLWKERALESFTGANKARDLHLSDGLYFPTIYKEHWFVFLVDIKYRNFIFLDSFFSQGSTYHSEIDDLLIKKFVTTWNEAGLKRFDFHTFGRAYPNVPKQKNGNDCGIFGMKYLELFCPRYPAQCSFSPLDIPAFRKIYAHDILVSRHNSEHDAKDLAFSFNPKTLLIDNNQ